MHFLTAGFIFIVAFRSVSAQLEHCRNCMCCIDGVCGTNKFSYNYEKCTHGCIEGTAGGKCLNSCPSYCKGCTREGEPIGVGPILCTSCDDGKYLDQAQNCSLCPVHCNTCESAISCTTCKHQYYNSETVTNCSLYCPENCECNSPGVCTNCKTGYYNKASNCTEKCPSNCVSCNLPSDCTVCKEGFYNGYAEDNMEALQYYDCSLACRSSCMACNSYNICSSCVTGMYGVSCLENCPSGCKESICDKDTGNCFNCKQNFRDAKCDTCINNYYTDTCLRECPSNSCKNSICDRINGTCTQCMNVFFGEFCNISCSDGCVDKTCTQSAGLCTFNCKHSFTGDKCCTHNGQCETCLSNDECKSCTKGFYGQHCNASCSENCEGGCDRTSGKCVICKVGSYGTFCERNCSAKCNGACSRENGTCSFGCIDGYHGSLCRNICHDNCKDQTCHQETGHCILCVDGFEGTTCLQKITKTGESIVGPVAGGVTGVIVVAVVLVGVFFFMRRRRNNMKDPDPSMVVVGKENNIYSNDGVDAEERVYVNGNANAPEATPKKGISTKSLNLEILNDELEDIGDINEKPLDQASCYYNVTPAIKVAAVCDFVMNKSIDAFREEFAKLPKHIQNPCTFAIRPENIKKNRYNGIYPYDHSRVTIDEEPDFFINACYIDGFKKEKKYIASIGPTSKTTEDFNTFWKMVWHERSDVIVILTNILETSVTKCEQYWPELNHSIQYGEIKVTCDKDSALAEHTIRTFALSKNSQKRTLTQIHYTAWSDNVIPDNVTSLVELRQRVTEATRATKGPIIVHCSAGVGRTGTYIALDKLIDEGEKTGSVNVWGCIMSMREQRVNMVQTLDQYLFLHKALAYALTTECKPIRAKQFVDIVRNMTPVTYENQLQDMACIIESNSEDEKAVVTNGCYNADKNRPEADIPGDRYRPRLFFNRTFNDSDYINANNIDSFTERNHFIITQTPLKKTVEDFLELAYQTNCSCIVSLGQNLRLVKDVGTYLPAQANSIKAGHFTVTCTKANRNAGYTHSQITIKNAGKQSAGSKNLEHFEYHNWANEDNAPRDAGKFVQFVNEVEMHADTTKDQTTPILVHCLYAGERSGLFCAVAILREKLQTENQVSVVNTVRQIQNRRKSAIGNKEQLEFCYRCIVTLLESSNIYANFTGNFTT